ncbi:hypothetical protein JX265_008183 [Neoarthrinium moseri]|uniref:SET domain-containing protein n=1 Tax=Neoarthrinium moseri TaxID=1658444 RepID=A0A9P9WIL7_9PEZI|nr:hypothetical protein JX265_008183 [Neoarthrinium moseri]
MRGVDLLHFCAAVVVAKHSIAAVVDQGWCTWQSLLYGVEDAQCSEGRLEFNEPADENHLSVASSWPVATSCVSGGNGTRTYCIYTDRDVARERGITIITTPSEALKLAKTTAFKDLKGYDHVKDLNAAESLRWRVEEVPGKGMGLIANRNLHAGDHIMSVSASIMIDYGLFMDIGEDVRTQMQARAIRSLPLNHQPAFLNLSTHDAVQSFEEQVDRIILTNAFDISDREIVENPEGVEDQHFFTVFPEVSRMNHDCRPNAHYFWDPNTFTQNVYAIKPVTAGEEITISYVDQCTQHERLVAESDERIVQILELQHYLRDYSKTSPATPDMAELLISLYEQERIHSRIFEAYTYAAIEYNAIGQPWMATKYARLGIQHGFVANQPTGEDHFDIKQLVDDPWGHWSYMMRRSNGEAGASTAHPEKMSI